MNTESLRQRPLIPRAGGASPSAPTTFGTTDFYFSCWLIIENKLPFDGCVASGRRVVFFFNDPERRGDPLLAEWLASNPRVPIKTLTEVARRLRGEMAAIQNGGAR